MARTKIDSITFREMFTSGAALLIQNRENVDALNVFPVPDGDTGTNMTQTINSAVKEMNAANTSSVSDVLSAIARGALKGARGNSGVILSQILRGFASALDGAEEIDSSLFIRMLRSGADTAYKAVMKPKEGTILTVARVMAEDVERAGRDFRTIEELFQTALISGDAILKKTPDMLPVLKQAGVVDSGGMGLMVIFRGMYAALSGEPVEVDEPPIVASVLPGDFIDDHAALETITFGYCTEFIVAHPRADMRESEVVRLRKRLEKIGDCVPVISDLSVVKVHVHTDDPGKALQMALELGELDAIKIDNMREEFRERAAKNPAPVEQPPADDSAEEKEYGIVSVALGDGLAEIFRELSIEQIVDGGQTMNPSIEDLYEAIELTRAKNVFVLPNNSNILLAAQQAAELTERNVVVLPTKSVPMGISAALAFNPEEGVEENAAAMLEAAEHVHTGSVTYAVRDTTFDDKDIHAGDIMGLIDNKLTLLGQDVRQVVVDVAAQMVTEDAALITIYYGSDVAEEDAQALLDELSDAYPDCDVGLQFGGQPLYYYLIAVE